MTMDFKEINKLIALMEKASLTEIEVEEGGKRVKLRKETPIQAGHSFPIQPQERLLPTPAETKAVENDGTVLIRSPIVGMFYRSSSPEMDAYVEVGDIVKKGQTLCIVEAMKLLNEIESEIDGKVAAVLVESGSSVEYGTPLFKIEPT